MPFSTEDGRPNSSLGAVVPAGLTIQWLKSSLAWSVSKRVRAGAVSSSSPCWPGGDAFCIRERRTSLAVCQEE